MIQEEINNYKTLDKIDFLPYIKKYKGKNIDELVVAIKSDYDHTELTDNPWCEGYIFNNLSDIELIDYLEKRYSGIFKIMEVITYIIY